MPVDEKLLKSLQEQTSGELLVDEPMSRYTSFRIGGPADLLITPFDQDSLERAVRLVRESSTPWFVMGNGSNLVFVDEGFHGVVFRLKKLDRIKVAGSTISAGAGCMLPLLSYRTASLSLDGLVFAAGIPGTLGGALFMNAGDKEGSISEIVREVVVLGDAGKENITRSQMSFDYRSSSFQQQDAVILEAVLDLEHTGTPDSLKKRIKEKIRKRKKSFPLNYPNAGSVFRNPPGDFAGRLVQKSGCKGLTVGGAMVSTRHANFIVNTGGAKCSDVVEIIDMVKSRVKSEFGIELKTEIEIVG